MPSQIINPTECGLLVTPVRQLYLHLMSFPTATAALTAWISAHGLSSDPIRAHIIGKIDRHTRPGRDGVIAQRRVRLISGRHILSEATIIYREYALSEDLREQLQSTDLPFGDIVATLSPSRRTTFARARVALHREISVDLQHEFTPVLDVHATVSTSKHGPIARVHETYGACLLSMMSSPLGSAGDLALRLTRDRALAWT